MIIRTLILLALLFTTKISLGQDWIYAGKSTKGDQFFVRSTANDQFGNKEVWIKEESKQLTYTKNGKAYTLTNGYCLLLQVFDCRNKRTNLKTVVYYSSIGQPVHRDDFDEYAPEWHNEVPDSIGEAVLEKVCELFNN